MESDDDERFDSAQWDNNMLYQISRYIANRLRERLFGEFWPWTWTFGLTLEVVLSDMKTAFIDRSSSLPRYIVDLNRLNPLNDQNPEPLALLQQQFNTIWNFFSPQVDLIKLCKLMEDFIGIEHFEGITDEYVTETPTFAALSECEMEFEKGPSHWNPTVFSSPFIDFLEVYKCFKPEQLQQLVIAYFLLMKSTENEIIHK